MKMMAQTVVAEVLARPYLAGLLGFTMAIGYGLVRLLEMLRAVQGVG